MKSTVLIRSFAIAFGTALFWTSSCAQFKENVLFLGNSYTEQNDLAQMIAQLSLSAGDTLTYHRLTPDGQTFMDHASSDSSLALIALGNWDHVVLQGQSQETSFPFSVVLANSFPYAQDLCDSIYSANYCTQPLFFMTWGRRDGDAGNCQNWPPVCTYEGMDDLIRERYQLMAEVNDAGVSPVGVVWRHLRENGTAIELYAADGSHPSLAGTYAAACCFYSVIFEKDPLLITENLELEPSDAMEIREAVHALVFSNLDEWNVGQNKPIAQLTEQWVNGFTYQFIDQSENAENIEWFYNEIGLPGDTLNHTFPGPGTYTVSLVAERCGISDTLEVDIVVTPSGIQEKPITSLSPFPNPATSLLFIDEKWVNSAYQIYDGLGQIALESSTYLKTGIEIQSLKEGIYYLSISNKNGHLGLGQFLIIR